MNLPPSSPGPLEDLSAQTQHYERYVVGVDLGQSRDPTAIAVVRRIDGVNQRPVFQVGHLERVPLGTPYPGVVGHVARMFGKPPLRGKSELVIDFTGVGRPVADLFQSQGMSPICVAITSGDTVTNEGHIYKVPKLTLISRVQALLHDGRLKIHKGLPDAPALVAELQEFRAEVTDSGYWKFGARAGKHDDLVLAVAIALWRSHGDNQAGFGLLEYYRQMANGIGVGAPTAAVAPNVTLRAPAGISTTTLYTMTGRQVMVRADGTVVVGDEDAKPLMVAGWQRIERDEILEPGRATEHVK
jgi:hypothetical protein